MRPQLSSRLGRLSGLASTLASTLSSTRGRAVACLVGLAVLAAVLQIPRALAYHGPWVFDDELGYQKLAQSIGTSGTLELFGKQGLSYSPLYPLVIAPVYALHLSGPA